VDMVMEGSWIREPNGLEEGARDLTPPVLSLSLSRVQHKSTTEKEWHIERAVRGAKYMF